MPLLSFQSNLINRAVSAVVTARQAIKNVGGVRMKSPAKYDPNRLDINWISYTFFRGYWDQRNLHVINTGICYNFAYIGYCLYPEVKLWSNYNHAWVQGATGRHYDSVAPKGKKHHEDLDTNLMCHDVDNFLAREQTVEEFKDTWQKFGRQKTTLWERLVRDIHKQNLQPLRT